MKKCENTLIGIPEKDVKGISGGERRRLAFGCEVNFIFILNNLIFAHPKKLIDYISKLI